MAFSEANTVVRERRIRLYRGGSGPPLLYLHDMFCYRWMPFHELLAEYFDVVFPVHPGCEGSDGLEGIDGMDDLIIHYLDLCDELRLERPLLLGTSLGGWVAAEWAVRHGESLAGLVLMDAMGLSLSGEPAADLLMWDAQQSRRMLFAAPDSAVAQELVPDTPAREALPGILQARQCMARIGWQFPSNPKLLRYLYRVRTPTLVIWGERDGVASPAHARAFQAHLPDCELVQLPDCGHLPYAERPEACVESILQFCKKHALARRDD